jgi:hypothetical protein
MSKTTIPTGGITDATIATGDIAADAVTNTIIADSLVQGIAAVWIKQDFNAPATDDSLNVSGTTDNGLGDFTVTINTDMGNANYAITGMASRNANSLNYHVVMIHDSADPAAGSYRLRCADVAGNDKDAQHVSTAIHGDLA